MLGSSGQNQIEFSVFAGVLLMAMLTQVSTVLLVVVSGMLGVIFSLVKVKTGGKQA